MPEAPDAVIPLVSSIYVTQIHGAGFHWQCRGRYSFGWHEAGLPLKPVFIDYGLTVMLHDTDHTLQTQGQYMVRRISDV